MLGQQIKDGGCRSAGGRVRERPSRLRSPPDNASGNSCQAVASHILWSGRGKLFRLVQGELNGKWKSTGLLQIQGHKKMSVNNTFLVKHLKLSYHHCKSSHSMLGFLLVNPSQRNYKCFWRSFSSLATWIWLYQTHLEPCILFVFFFFTKISCTRRFYSEPFVRTIWVW